MTPGDGEHYLVAERWKGDDGLVVAGPCDRDEIEEARQERLEAPEPQDYQLMAVTHNALTLLEMGSGTIEVAEGVEWSR